MVRVDVESDRVLESRLTLVLENALLAGAAADYEFQGIIP